MVRARRRIRKHSASRRDSSSVRWAPAAVISPKLTVHGRVEKDAAGEGGAAGDVGDGRDAKADALSDPVAHGVFEGIRRGAGGLGHGPLEPGYQIGRAWRAGDVREFQVCMHIDQAGHEQGAAQIPFIRPEVLRAEGAGVADRRCMPFSKTTPASRRMAFGATTWDARSSVFT